MRPSGWLPEAAPKRLPLPDVMAGRPPASSSSSNIVSSDIASSSAAWAMAAGMWATDTTVAPGCLNWRSGEDQVCSTTMMAHPPDATLVRTSRMSCSVIIPGTIRSMPARENSSASMSLQETVPRAVRVATTKSSTRTPPARTSSLSRRSRSGSGRPSTSLATRNSTGPRDRGQDDGLASMALPS